MPTTRLLIGAAALLTAASASFGQQHQPAPRADDGPSSLSETYEDWRVACAAAADNKTTCSFSQVQVNQNGQRVLTVELMPAKDDGLNGILVMPFGLNLDKGVTFAIDDTSPGKPSRFRTCLPGGCVVRLTFTQSTTAVLKSGSMLKLGAIASDTEKDVTFSVSLKGFQRALERTVQLRK
ncbi:invasion associated locus B family protein [Brucella anthropi]|uniref:invasion associated locus B family protein n=1 Tax=Brucella anthropi TaxID=529 RepID=UPI00124DB5FC|nr:invasion associated locus B family protein [Brucella anthropi]KAB2770270.1 invasion associated locus B family protein [Brucella anthropi]